MKNIKIHILLIVFLLTCIGCDPVDYISCTTEFRVTNSSSRLLEVVFVWDNDDVTEILFKKGANAVFWNHLCVCKMTDPNDYIKSVTILNAEEDIIKEFNQHDETGKLLGLTWVRVESRFILDITDDLLDL